MTIKTTIALMMSLIFSVTALNAWSCDCKGHEKRDGKDHLAKNTTLNKAR